jgi:putative spermidine/putrescine transport system ATP-binding protein
VAGTLALVQLGDLAERKPAELSGGQRQRVALARAVVFEPRILLMDEPLSALDKNLRESMQLEIRRLHERLGVTTLYVTHDQREALTMSDRVVVMRDGRVVQEGTPASIYGQPRTSFVGTFVGESYLLPIERSSGVPTVMGRRLHTDGIADVPANARHSVLVRPERLRICGGPVGDGLNAFSGTYRGSVYQGDTVLVQMLLEGGRELGMRCGATDPALSGLPAVGEALTMTLAAANTIVVRDEAD